MKNSCSPCVFGVLLCDPDKNESCVPKRGYLKEQEIAELKRQGKWPHHGKRSRVPYQYSPDCNCAKCVKIKERLRKENPNP